VNFSPLIPARPVHFKVLIVRHLHIQFICNDLLGTRPDVFDQNQLRSINPVKDFVKLNVDGA
jgi:hypothetical protein